MVRLTTGDDSGRADTFGVDIDLAECYAKKMFDAVLFVKFDECKRLHTELNKDWSLYQLSMDLFKKLCKERGFERIGKWREYIGET